MPRTQHTQDLEVTQPKARTMKGTGPAIEALDPETVDAEPKVSVKSHIDPDWAENMAFNKEMITIRVEDASNETDEKQVTVWNNGDMMVFHRGQETTCERRFVETLMRAKPTKYSQKAILDELGKVGAYQEIPHRALRYHFSVVKDDNPLGPAWLKAILAQG